MHHPTPTLLPFSGSALANPEFNEHTPNSESRICNPDFSGKVSYRYNSLGFRGEEYNPAAKYHIFVCGPSEAFGLGLNENEIWSHHFKCAYAQEKGVTPDDINLLNFSQVGASMDYIARVVVSQCQRIKPDLVIAELAPSTRTEYISDVPDRPFSGKAIRFNPNILALLTQQDQTETFRTRTADLSPDDIEELVTAVEGFYSFYTNSYGVANRIKNVLLIQQYCDANKIPHLIWSLHRHSLEKQLALPLPDSITALTECIDFERIYTHGVLHPQHQRAADGKHPGPDINWNIAQHLWRFHQALVTT